MKKTYHFFFNTLGEIEAPFREEEFLHFNVLPVKFRKAVTVAVHETTESGSGMSEGGFEKMSPLKKQMNTNVRQYSRNYREYYLHEHDNRGSH